VTFWRELTKLELALAGAIVLGIAGLVAWDPSNAGLNLATEGLGVVASVLVLEQVLERRQRAREALLADQTTGAVLARVDQAVERFGRSLSAAMGLPWYVQHATREANTWQTRIADLAWTPGQATLPRRLPDWEKRRQEGDDQVASDLDRIPDALRGFREALEDATFRLSVLLALSERVNATLGQLQRILDAAEHARMFRLYSDYVLGARSAGQEHWVLSGERVRDLALLIADYLDTRPRPPRRGSA
jgi:hypothetical protein